MRKRDKTLAELFDKWVVPLNPQGLINEPMLYFNSLHYKGNSINDIKKIHPEMSYEQIALLKLAVIIGEIKTNINMMNEKMTLNMRGNFIAKDKEGNFTVYRKGDVVRYKNQDYVATRIINDGRSPKNEKSGWKPLSLNDVMDSGTFPDE